MLPALIIRCLFMLSASLPPGTLTICCFEPEDGKISVTVVTILASKDNDKVDPKLVDVAREVQKKDPDLKGFQLRHTTCRTIVVGTKETFTLIDDNELIVEARNCTEKPGRICLKLKAPTLSCLSYTCACSKYFPIVTGYETKDGQRLIIAVMVESSCKAK
jgi:hypothetical protein